MNEPTLYLPGTLAREALALLKSEQRKRAIKGRISRVSWGIRVSNNGATLTTQGWINNILIDSTMAL